MWYIFRDGAEFGPFTTEGISALVTQHRVDAATLLRKEGDTQWHRADDFGFVQAGPTHAPALPSAYQPVDQMEMMMAMAQMRSPGLAAVLSFLIPGLGQLYCGSLFGLVLLFAAIVADAFVVAAMMKQDAPWWMGTCAPLFALGVHVVATLDSFSAADRANRRTMKRLKG